MSSNLSEDIYELYFNFRKELFGITSQSPLWERGLNNVNDDLGQLVIKLYGKKHVSDKTIEEVYEMIENIKQAFRESIMESTWMQEETRQEMLKKLNNLSANVVYQKKWKDYSNLRIKRDDFFGNKIRYYLNEYQYALDNLDNPINKDETEIRINSASYDPSLNMFIIGAGYITSPYFNSNNDNAANYGALGNVIAHEIGHAFDKLGSEFDSSGNARNWWTEKDKSEFEKISQTLVDQFNQYEVLDNLYINGEYTLNENMADLTSIVIPLRAYRKTLKTNDEGPVLDGFTGIQRFFIAYAQTWMYKSREEYLKRQIATDPHAPVKFRVNGIVNNVNEFYKAFNLKVDDSLFLKPSDRVKLW
jgi:putative endopeptidase